MTQCHDARCHLDRLLLSPDGDLPDELLAARDHFAQCDDCRALWIEADEFDRRVSARMVAVEAPAGLTERLRNQMPANLSRPAAHGLHRSSRRRSWLWGIAAAALILVCCTPVVLWTLSAPTLSGETMLSLLVQSDHSALERWPPAGTFEFPAGWSAMRRVSSEPFHRGAVRSVPVEAARFTIKTSDGERSAGVVWRISERSIADFEQLPGLRTSEVRYGPGCECLVWRESGSVYVVVLNGHALHDLQERLLAHRTIS